MKSSQLSAQLAAFIYLQIPFSEKLLIKGFTKNSPNKDILKKDDVIITFDSHEVSSGTQLRELLQKSNQSKAVLEVARMGERIAVPITIKNSQTANKNQKKNEIGILVSEKYDFPYQLKIRLKDVGGPSAGLIFTLSIIDKLTSEDLVKGRNIAGTGTISPAGKVGPIGGIEEKLIGAAREGATLFLAPALNCPDIRHTPKGLRVVPVDNLTEAIAALREKDPERLPMCG